MGYISKSLFAILLITGCLYTKADPLAFEYKSPAFSGIGYSTHVLTIEQLESNRKQKLKDERQSKIDQAKRDLQSTNAYKFQNNLESRIYAQLSKQISDKLFGEGATLTDGTWYSAETPFGDNVSWKRENDRIYVEIKDSNNNTTASFDVPVGEFAF
jgi:hypothetical protein